MNQYIKRLKNNSNQASKKAFKVTFIREMNYESYFAVIASLASTFQLKNKQTNKLLLKKLEVTKL